VKTRIVLGSFALTLAVAFAAITLPDGPTPQPKAAQVRHADGPEPICPPPKQCALPK